MEGEPYILAWRDTLTVKSVIDQPFLNTNLVNPNHVCPCECGPAASLEPSSLGLFVEERAETIWFFFPATSCSSCWPRDSDGEAAAGDWSHAAGCGSSWERYNNKRFSEIDAKSSMVFGKVLEQEIYNAEFIAGEFVRVPPLDRLCA